MAVPDCIKVFRDDAGKTKRTGLSCLPSGKVAIGFRSVINLLVDGVGVEDVI